jgi:hypothetical protein
MYEHALIKAIPDIPPCDVDGVLIRQLKHWAVSGLAASDRSDHMNPNMFQRYVPLANLPDEEKLDAELKQLAKRRRTA